MQRMNRGNMGRYHLFKSHHLAKPVSPSRVLRVGVLIGVMSVLAAACNSSTGSSKPTASSRTNSSNPLRLVDYANVTDSGSLQVAIQNGFVKAAKVLGGKIDLYNNNASDSTTVNNARLMVANHPSLIVEFDNNVAVNPEVGSIFKAAHIPCVAVVNAVPGCALLNENAPAIGGALGTALGKQFSGKGWTGANTTVLGLVNWSGGVNLNGGVTEFYQNFAKVLPGMTQASWRSITPSTTRLGSNLYVLNCGSVPGPCQTAVSEVLPDIPSSRHIIVMGTNDNITDAALTAAKTAGRTHEMYAASTADSVTQLRSNPQVVGVGEIFASYWGEYALAAAATGKDVGTIQMPYVPLTKQNQSTTFGTSSVIPKELPPVPSADNGLVSLKALKQFKNVAGLN
jgi:ABC-type sugar transport system substrate-binding protein